MYAALSSHHMSRTRLSDRGSVLPVEVPVEGGRPHFLVVLIHAYICIQSTITCIYIHTEYQLKGSIWTIYTYRVPVEGVYLDDIYIQSTS